MSLLLTLLPIYLFGNLHCLGMCGPLVMMIGQHRYRGLYFLGRALSYTLTGWLAGYLGFVLGMILSHYHVGAGVSLIFGVILIYLGLFDLPKWTGKGLANLNNTLTLLILRDQPLPTFLFGFFTILLPCGQTLIVFSACAMAQVAWVGALNGFVFALLTSPSLFLAMRLTQVLARFQRFSNVIISSTACGVGILSLMRGMAEMGWIPHLILNEKYHMVLW